MRAALLLLLSCMALPVQAAGVCSPMRMPPAELRQVSRGFGHGHTGIDLMAPMGSPVLAAAGGSVVYAGWYFAYGRIVDIEHADGVITRYAHMLDFARGIGPGSTVEAGQVIGRVGATGRAHGAHVHFEVRLNGRPVDPAPFLGLAGCQSLPHGEPLEEAVAPLPSARRR